MSEKKRLQERLFSAVLILFILQALLLPLVIDVTYASRSSNPEHILTYNNHKLTWDRNTEVDTIGSAKLKIFDTEYSNIKSDDSDNIVAPGSENKSIVRLLNRSDGKVEFTAVLYEIKSDDIPLFTTLTGDDLQISENYSIPENATLVRAVKGNLPAHQMRDFEINWSWEFDVSDIQNGADTVLSSGPETSESSALLGFYITVTDNNAIITPSSPITGDETNFRLYLMLLLTSGALLILLIIQRKQNGKENI